MLGLWQFARGFVRVKVTGFGLERFLNMAAFRGVYLWDVECAPDGVLLNVSVKGFKMLKGCARKTKCRTKIMEKNGIPFFLHRYRRRKLLMGGVLFFVLGMFVLSSFVWRIEIAGNETLPHDSIIVFLQEQGLVVGALKWNLDDGELQQALMGNFPQLSWADVHTRGTRTSIMLAEIIPPQEIIDRQTPTHVIATAEGLITGIATSAGAPMVRQNDVVQQGEMLVSGILELEPDTPGTALVYVHAEAEVWARRYHAIEFVVPLAYTEKIFTGDTTRRREVQLLFAGNRRLPIPGRSIGFDSYERITTRHQPGSGGDYPMPIVLITNHYAEFIPETRTRTIDEAKELAERMVTGRIIREFDFAIDIISREITFEESPSGLAVNALITTHERIDKQVKITVE